MSVPIDTINLALYFVQQLGIMFGVGAATILLIAYLVSTRDRTIDSKEEQFARAVYRVLEIGLWLIVLSGALITGIHFGTGGTAIILTPAYLFKWALITVIILGEALRRKQVFMNFAWEGFLGANWYALFVVHVLAPVALWIDLLVLYAIWTTGFVMCFVSLTYAMRAQSSAHKVEKHTVKKPVVPSLQPRKIVAQVSTPKLVPPPPSVPKPIEPKPVVAAAPPKPAVPPVPHKPPVLPHKPMPIVASVPHIAPKVSVPVPIKRTPLELHKPPQPPLKVFSGAVPQHEELPGLPAIRVMPRSMADVDKLRQSLSNVILPAKNSGQVPMKTA